MESATAAREESPPAVNSSDLSGVSVVEQAEGVSTRAGAARLGYRQCRCYGNRSICRIAATLQDVWTQTHIQV